MGLNESTTRRCIDILTDALMVRQLQPRYVNLGKRQVKSPRIYIRDSGPPHLSLGIDAPKLNGKATVRGPLPRPVPWRLLPPSMRFAVL